MTQALSETPADPVDAKARLRREAFAARKVAHAASAADAAAAAAARFQRDGLAAGHHIISGYRPIRTEIDPTPLMEALVARGHRLCVPVIEGAGLPLSFREWTPGCEMVEGAFGAEVPAQGEWLVPSLLIAPLVAFDRACRRLGYGGGFYDRTLAKLRPSGPTMAVGLAYSAQEMAQIPDEPTDQRLDAIVTEASVIRPEAA
ncbi:5-formyltetrahydrofolate cyclo-ligase [Limibaculum sp. M0105]|uniref:5-formyltetrahydrofolate cyclo-ligase n=1 Tax=Thermohalobaculum xanthum TaxID=2753746 RepID=A0A8J7M4C5_9RHOB|nr:5-formyltetrahydrofolate cyclo-ligase [Thermohalobaculum xanthum]MBK0398014.1 5-formyltetrahydrofolate cyclo-ligase [Thermohalobaculum xanthum]